MAHGVLAFAVFFGVLHAGGRYFYCEAFGLMASDPCASTPRDANRENPSGTLAGRHADCCAIVTLDAMPQAARVAGPSVAPAALVATLPALGLTGRLDASAPSQRHRGFERWRPPPRASNDVRSALMVFLI